MQAACHKLGGVGSHKDTAEYKSECDKTVGKARVTLMEKKMLEALVIAKNSTAAESLDSALSEIKLQTQNMGQIKPSDIHPTIWTSCGLLMRGDSPFQQ